MYLKACEIPVYRSKNLRPMYNLPYALALLMPWYNQFIIAMAVFILLATGLAGLHVPEQTQRNLFEHRQRISTYDGCI